MVQLSTQPEARLCRLQYANRVVEVCPEERCPLWESGGAVLEGRCALEQVDLSGRADLASWLLRVRQMLEAAKTAEQENDARRLFYRLLNEGSE